MLRTALAGLEGPTAQERRAAERWLAIHLERSDFSEVAEAVSVGGAEVVLRLGSALSSDARHLGLAALCASDYDDDLREVGERAIRGLVRQWLTSVEPLSFERFLEEVDGADLLGLRSSMRCSVAIAAGPLAVQVGRLDRALADRAQAVADAVIGVAIDPVISAGEIRSPARGRVTGTWAQVFRVLVGQILGGSAELEIEGFGGAGGASWIYIRPGSVRRRTGDEVLLDWLQRFESSRRSSERVAIARALAGTGWPAAQAYLEHQWLEERDAAAYVGLLYAAARGRVSACLTTRAAFELLLSACETHAGSEAAEAHLRVLTRIGPVGALGEDLAAATLEGWEQATAGGLWLRLVVFESMGRLPDGLGAQLEGWVSGPSEVPGFLAWQALRTLAECGAGSSPSRRLARIESADRLLAAGFEAEPDVEAVLAWLERARAVPAERWSAQPDLGYEEPAARLACACWWILVDELQLAGELLRGLAPTLAADPDFELSSSEQLAYLARSGYQAEVASALGDSGSGWRSERTWQRLRLLTTGLASEPAQALYAAQTALSTDAMNSVDFVVLGILAVEPATADLARPELFQRIVDFAGTQPSEGLADPWVTGLERAFQHALSRGDSQAFSDLLRRLRAALEGSEHPLLATLEAGIFPSPPGRPPLALETLDRELSELWFRGR